MSPGKMASQAGHAFVGAIFSCSEIDPERYKDAMADQPNTKIVLSASNEKQLLKSRDLAVELKLPHYLMTDSGHVMPPHFDGNPIVTALGIGPCTRDEAWPIARRLQLVP